MVIFLNVYHFSLIRFVLLMDRLSSTFYTITMLGVLLAVLFELLHMGYMQYYW
jgi:hypothetical protein